MDDMTRAFEKQLGDVLQSAAGPSRPVDVAAVLQAVTATAPVGHGSVITRRIRGGRLRTSTDRGFSMSSALKLVVAALVVALVSGFLLSGVLTTQQDQAPAAPSVPSGAERILPGGWAETTRLTHDGRGDVWAIGDGLMHFSEQGGALTLTGTWTLADDAAFATGVMAPAQDGGVWLGGATIQRFDGSRFADGIEAPQGEVFELLEAPDGALWAMVDDGSQPYDAAWRWDGSKWTDMAAGHALGSLGVDAKGRVWVLLGTYPGPDIEGVAVYDDGSWRAYRSEDHRLLGSGNHGSLEVAPGGEVYVRTAGSVLTFDGSTWTELPDEAISGAWQLSVGPEGVLWGYTDDAVYVRSPGGSFEPVDGPVGGWRDINAVEALLDGAFVTTKDGWLRVRDGSTETVWTPPSALQVDPHQPYRRGNVVATETEVWVSDAQGVWRCPVPAGAEGCRQVMEGLPDMVEGQPLVLERAPDGTLWSTGPGGTARLDGERWTVIDDAPGQALAIGLDGTVWVGAMGAEALDFTAWREDASGWSAEHHPGPGGLLSPDIHIAPDGTVWVQEGGYGRTLLRFDGTTWTKPLQKSIAGLPLEGIGDADIDAEGHLWILWTEPAGDGYSCCSSARLDGDDWTVFDVPSDWPRGLVVGADGSVWLGGGGSDGLLRFDGSAWIPAGLEGSGVVPLDVSDDGTVWFTDDGGGLYHLPRP